ncbi:Similar to Protein C1orf43 homolog (Rattus norvegicus) [Cotesia congregata]|uniref:Similar to Protein C1orf43 homolog (Rattus norvegicus) n=1 Tax=Cotesia congregata TaxID=51543 RepID=A0A8J2MVW7_COTCN|nr:Similar to Protein C1orf43 homolog (Rattus norvegicus) [Cotesia congregata]
MNNSSYFGKYSLSEATINKLTNHEELLKPTYQSSDSAWHRLFNSEETEEEIEKKDESMEIDEVDEDESGDESMLPSSQFFFTQVQRKKPATPVALQEIKGADLNNVVEILFEALEQSKKLNTEFLKDLTDSEVLTVIEKLAERLNLNHTHDLCNSLCDMQGDCAVQYIKPICSKLLLQKIVDLEEPARIITLAVNKLMNKFLQDVQKLIFIPLVNADLKDTSVIKVWHMSVIPALINIKIDNNLKDRLIQLLLDKSTTFSKDKNYSKFILSFIKLNPPFSGEQKSSLDEIVAINETIFKKAMESLLNKMNFHPDSCSHAFNMTEELSGVTIVVFIAAGVLTFLLLFIFAKRQIMRFALRSRRGPHISIGQDAKKSLKRELERRIQVIPRIQHEPQLISDPRYIMEPGSQVPPHYYPALNGSGQRMIHQFCDLYEHARHDPTEFTDEEYQVYSRLHLKLIDAARLLKSYPSSRKSSPSRTPIKKNVETKRNILEPRMRPPEEQVLSGSRPNTLTVMALDNTETSV